MTSFNNRLTTLSFLSCRRVRGSAFLGGRALYALKRIDATEFVPQTGAGYYDDVHNKTARFDGGKCRSGKALQKV